MSRKKQKPPEAFQEPIRIDDVLDLHGFFPEQIPEIVSEFLAAAVARGFSEVRIVHGKGRSRLKWEVRQHLQDHPAVGRFGDAPPERGGWGATVVQLRAQTK